jgi:hypothetical protein
MEAATTSIAAPVGVSAGIDVTAMIAAAAVGVSAGIAATAMIAAVALVVVPAVAVSTVTISIMTVITAVAVAVVSMAVAMSVPVPRAGTDEDAAYEPVRSIVAIGCTGVWGVVIVAIGTYGRGAVITGGADSHAESDLSVRVGSPEKTNSETNAD